jgi:hypothetical protein
VLGVQDTLSAMVVVKEEDVEVDVDVDVNQYKKFFPILRFKNAVAS